METNADEADGPMRGMVSAFIAQHVMAISLRNYIEKLPAARTMGATSIRSDAKGTNADAAARRISTMGTAFIAWIVMANCTATRNKLASRIYCVTEDESVLDAPGTGQKWRSLPSNGARRPSNGELWAHHRHDKHNTPASHISDRPLPSKRGTSNGECACAPLAK